MLVKLHRNRWRRFAFPAGLAAVGLALLLMGLLKPLPTYLVATGDLIPGQPLSPGQFMEVELELGSLAPSYAANFQPGQMLSEFVAAGELVPLRLLEPIRTGNQTLLRITPAAQPAASVRPGSSVAIWLVAEIEEQSQPTLLVPAALVVEVIEPDGLFASDVSLYELQLSKDQATAVITALATDLPLFLVPTS